LSTRTGRGGWQDDHLRVASLRVSEPESIAGLCRHRPDPERQVEVIGYYDETPPGGRKSNPYHPFVWCCHCGKPTHWKGYVIRDSEDDLFIIGAQNCGRDHYGVHFEEAERAFNQQLRRQRALQRWDYVQLQIPIVTSRIDLALHSDELRQIDEARQAFKAASSDCYRQIVRHIQGRIPLKRRLSERDYDAENKRRRQFERSIVAFNAFSADERRALRRDGLAPVEDHDPMFREWTEDYGQIEGGEFLIEEDDLRSRLLKVKSAISAIEAVAKLGTANVQTTKLSRLVADFRKALEDVFSRNIGLGFDSFFFATENVARLAKWADGFDHFGIEASDKGLVVIDRARRRTNIPRFEAAAFPIADELNAIAREIELLAS